MRRRLTPTALNQFIAAPPRIQRAFDKQIKFLVEDIRHPSLRAKKFDEAKDRWQARINQDWRFYFTIDGDTYTILDIVPHPK